MDFITHICYVWLNLHLQTENILDYHSFRNMKYFFDSLSFMTGGIDLKYPAFVFAKHFPSLKGFYIWGYSSRSFLNFSIYQDAYLRLCCLMHRKQEWVFVLCGNSLSLRPSLTAATQPLNKLITFRTNIWELSEFLLYQFISTWVIAFE